MPGTANLLGPAVAPQASAAVSLGLAGLRRGFAMEQRGFGRSLRWTQRPRLPAALSLPAGPHQAVGVDTGALPRVPNRIPRQTACGREGVAV